MRHRVFLAVSLLAMSLTACAAPTERPGELHTTPPAASTTPTSGVAEVNEANIYEICVEKIINAGQLAKGDRANVSFAPQSEATTLIRDDGYIGVYFEAEDGNNTFQSAAGIVCIAKGNSTNPDWDRFGVGPVLLTIAEIEHTLQLQVMP